MERAAFVLNPFDDVMSFDRGTVSPGATSSLGSTEVYAFRDSGVHDVHFARSDGDRFELLVTFDMGFLTHGDNAVALDLFHPAVDGLSMTVGLDPWPGMSHLLRGIDDVSDFALRLDVNRYPDFVGRRKQVLQFTKDKGNSKLPSHLLLKEAFSKKKVTDRVNCELVVYEERGHHCAMALDSDLLRPCAYFVREEELRRQEAT